MGNLTPENKQAINAALNNINRAILVIQRNVPDQNTRGCETNQMNGLVQEIRTKYLKEESETSDDNCATD